MLKTTKGFVGGEYHLATVLPIAVIMFLLIGVRAIVVAAALLEEGVRDSFLSLVLSQMLPHLTRVLQRRPATIQTAMMMIPAQVTGTVACRGYQIGQFRGGELLTLLLLLGLLMLRLVDGHGGTTAGGDGGRRRG